MRRAAVERIEIDSLGMAAEHSDYLGHAAQLAVRDCDAVADRGRAQPLALGEHRGQVSELDLRVLGGQRFGQFIQDLGLGGALQIGNDHVRAEDIGNFHFVVPVQRKSEKSKSKHAGPCEWLRRSAALNSISLPLPIANATRRSALAKRETAANQVSSPALRTSPVEGDLTFFALIFSRCFFSWRPTLSASRSITE